MIRFTVFMIFICFGQTQALDVSSRERLGSVDDDDKALVVCNANPIIGGDETKKAARWNVVSALSDYCISEQSLQDSEVPYDTAKDLCSVIGGSLPVITDELQAQIQFNFVSQHSVSSEIFWTGLRRKGGRLISGNGYRAGSFRDWISGQSDASLAGDNECAVMKMTDGKWRAADCDRPMKFYCVASKGKFPMTMVIIISVVFLIGLLLCCLACFCCCGTAIVVSLRACFGKYDRHSAEFITA